MTKPLEGVRILDFGRVIASGYCGTMLADMGAEVIKIERPGGEFDRQLGPFEPGGRAIVYEMITPRNKKSITLDFTSQNGRGVLDELVKLSSIVISGFTPKGNQLFGLNYERLKEVNPEIILVAISGYGQDGPYADRPCFDAIAQAESGAMSYSGFPGNPPTRSAVPFADFSTAILGAYGAILALFHKERTGEGQLVDVSLLDSAFTFVAGMGVLAEYTLMNHVRPQVGNHSYYNFTDAFKAKDGWIMISVIGNKIWQRFTELLDRKDLQGDERFNDDLNRFQNRHQLCPIVSDWVAGYTVNELIQLLEEKRVPCGRINSVRNLENNPQIRAREMYINMHYPGVGNVPIPGIPVKLSKTPGIIENNAPNLGEHNIEIYSHLLGYNQEEVDSLKNEGLI